MPWGPTAAWSAHRTWADGKALSPAEVVTEALLLTADMLHGSNDSVLASVQATPVLTARERDVLILLCQRATDAEIASQLFISRRTVHHHVGNLLGKFGAANRREVGAMAARLGLF